MPRWKQQPEEQSDVYMWPWEDEVISTAEYMRSLQDLDHFLTDVNVPTLQTLDDVSAVASLIGHDLRVIAIVKGAKIEKRTEILDAESHELLSSSKTEYVLTTWQNNMEIMVTASEGEATVSERSLIGFQRYQRESLRVKLPTDRDITIGGNPNIDDLDLYALDLRTSYMREYHPVREPSNPEVQQGFTYILREALQDVKNIVLLSR